MIEELVRVPGRAMAIFAHPDDAEIACGATLARWVALGTRVVLAVATRGDKGGDGTDPVGLAEERSRELLDAGAILGVSDLIQLAYGDGELANDLLLRERLVSLMRRFRPEVVITSDPTVVFVGDLYYNHRDHRELGWAVLDAAFPAALERGYFPDAGEPLARLEVLLAATTSPNVLVRVEGFLDHKVQAMAAHRAQLARYADALEPVIRERARQSARMAGLEGEAELYRRVAQGAAGG
jgi:LmbE family N-acetylglucosaminyl deacetylase